MRYLKMTGCLLAAAFAVTGMAAPLELRPETLQGVELVEGLAGKKAILLKGPESNIEIAYPENPDTVAVEAWIKLPEKPVFSHIVKRRGKNNQWQMFVAPSGNEYVLHGMSWKKSDGKDNFFGKSSMKMSGGKFYHVAMEIDGTNSAKLFINGTEVYSGVPVEAMRQGSSPVTIGGGKAGEPCELTIQDVIVYDSKLPEGWQQRIKGTLTETQSVKLQPQSIQGDSVIFANGGKGKISGDVSLNKDVLQLKGPESMVEVPYPENPETMAVEAWIKLPEKPVFSHILKRRGKSNQWQMFVSPSGNEYMLYGMGWKKSDGKDSFFGKSSIKVQGGKFYHVAMEIDGINSAKLFINGVEVYSGIPADVMRQGSNPLTIGGGKAGEACELMIQGIVVYGSKLPEGWQQRVKEQFYPWERKFSTEQVLNFTGEGAWVTAPVELLKTVPEDNMWSARNRFGNSLAPRLESKSMKALAMGTEASADGLRWNRHNEFPTLHALQVPADWSTADTVSLKISSKEATGELIYLAFSADSDKTPYRDYYCFPFAVNFTGEKTVSIDRNKFEPFGEPAGWDRIDGIYFFSKMFGAEAHPATDLTLKSLRLDSAGKDNSVEFAGDVRREKDEDGFVFKMVKAEYQRYFLNHPYPETRGNQTFAAPYTHQNYQATERAIFDYRPNFLPGFISYGLDGKAYIHSGDLVQYKGADGKWQYTDLIPVLKKWAKEQSWPGLQLSWGLSLGEKAIRYDQSGDFYLMVPVEKLDEQGNHVDWHTRSVLLLHSRDKMKTFDVYKLPGRVANFEKLDGHNHDCLKRPPVVLLGDYSYFSDGDPAGYVLLPKKKSDGTLELGTPVKYAEFAISPDQHSGGGNQVITRGDKLFIVFGVASINAIAMQNVKGAQKTVMPPIPEDHPGLKLTYEHNRSGKIYTESSKNGTPAFIVEYDMANGKLGEARYILSGGGTDDGHNWPSITVDSRGILHVIANGHHNPLCYTSSREADNPYGAWNDPIYVKPDKALPQLSYATLNCTKDDTILTVHRSTTNVYNNHLGLYFKPANGPWQGEDTLVTPYRYMYKVWGHKAIYNPATGGITLGFYSHSSMKQIMMDQYLFDIFHYPDQEKIYRGGKQDAGLPEANKAKMYIGQGSELTLLTYEPVSKKWQLTVGRDLK